MGLNRWVRNMGIIHELDEWHKGRRVELGRRMARDVDGGVAGRSYEATGGGAGGHADPTLVAAMSHLGGQRRDDIAGTVAEMDRLLVRIVADYRRHRELAAKLLPIPEAEEEVRKDGLMCANPACGARVKGTQDDRLRGDRCKACYEYLRENKIERPWRFCIRAMARK